MGIEGFHGRTDEWLDDDGGRHCIDGSGCMMIVLIVMVVDAITRSTNLISDFSGQSPIS